MRFSPLSLGLALAASTIAAPSLASLQAVDPASKALVERAEAQLKAGDFVAADDTLEAALVLDPKNGDAFTAMAKVAIKQKLYGQAIKYGRKALTIDPTDRAALAVQGEAMVELGALGRARQNLDKLAKLCPDNCTERQQLSAVIERGPVMAQAKTGDAPKAN
ncbi:tetratricopeptide repeat protein [Sphingomicrobium flavum]|uniref:tetratricopeptide repeat protein n=1 Tax=Sphingomicrobium flavum TaxID=1229164 RepID=UPI0021AE0DE6|nr:hypothetical protein [Sphingomicrobium flavum]